MEYAESRLYAAGDDARHIDWRVSARTGRTHTKIFHTERDRLTLLVADTAATLYFGTRSCFKSVQAARVGALVAWAALRAGDRLTILRGSRSEAPQPPSGGVRGVLRTLECLRRWYSAVPAEDAGLEHALQASQRLARPGSRLVLLLDPRSVEALGDARLQALSAHLDACAVLLVDPLELAPPHAALAFAASQGRIELDLRDRQQQQRWRASFAERFETSAKRLQTLGWKVLKLRTDEAPERVLSALLPARREVA